MTEEQNKPVEMHECQTTPEHRLARYAKVNDFARMVGIDPSTARRWLAQGIVAGVRIGKTTIRVDLESLKTQPIGAAA